MDIFNLNTNLEHNEKYPKLDSWFDFMNKQMKRMQESRNKGEINNILIDNDIDLID